MSSELSGQSNPPTLIGLCPDPSHTVEFYMPLDHGESRRCPLDDCERELVIYCRADDVDRRVREAYATGAEDEAGIRG